MTRYGYITGRTKDQALMQHDVLTDCGIDFDGGIVMETPWIDFFSRLQPDDEVVVVAESRLGATPHERQARKEMLDMVGVKLITLTREFQKGKH